MILDYERSEIVGECVYFYKNDKLVAVYNPFVGLVRKKDSD